MAPVFYGDRTFSCSGVVQSHSIQWTNQEKLWAEWRSLCNQLVLSKLGTMQDPDLADILQQAEHVSRCRIEQQSGPSSKRHPLATDLHYAPPLGIYTTFISKRAGVLHSTMEIVRFVHFP